MGEHISTLADDECEAISDNWITVFRETPDGGTVDSDMGTSIIICVDDEPDPISVSHITTATHISYWYIITDDNDNILAWSTDPVIDLNGAGIGTCRIWGWNYKGLPDPVVGDPISSLDDEDCESISSNFIEVERVDDAAPCVNATFDAGSVAYLNIFPNPAGDFVQVEYEELEVGNGQLQILDLNGKILQTTILEFRNDNIQLNIADIPGGYYFIRIESGQRRTTQKLVIVK